MSKPPYKDISESTITLLEPLIELLAESVHDRWIETRKAQGWSYGETRNDELKTHPSMIAYSELSEDEKDLDRQTASQSIQSILDLGYLISKP